MLSIDKFIWSMIHFASMPSKKYAGLYESEVLCEIHLPGL